MSRKRQDSDVAELEGNAAANQVAQPSEMSPATRVRQSSVRQLAPVDIQPMGHKWHHWNVVAHADHTIEDALNSRYLTGKINEFSPLDYIEIKHPFGYWVICLDVIKVDRVSRGLVAHIRHIFDYTKADRVIAPDLSGARVDFLGGDKQWSVVDGHHIAMEGFPTRTAAEAWLSEQKRV